MTVAAYLRFSAKGKDSDSLETQKAILATTARGMGYEITRWYADEESGWIEGRVRPEWEALKSAIETGAVTVLFVREEVRLTRDLEEGGRFYKWLRQGKFKLYGPHGEDLNNELFPLKIFFGDQYSAAISRMVKLQKRNRANEGKPQGSRFRTFGYNRDWTIHYSERLILVEIFERFARGESANAITNDLNRRGITTTSGGVFRRDTVVGILQNPLYMGKMRYKGEVIGDANVTKIISESLFEAAQMRFGTKSQPAAHAKRYLLSGIAVCSLCDHGLYGNVSSRGRYLCRPPVGCGKVSINVAWLDASITAAVYRAMKHDLSVELPTDLEPSIKALDERRAAVRADVAAGLLPRVDGYAILRDIDQERRALVREQAKQQQRMPDLRAAEDWAHASLTARRAYIRQYISAVIVKPTTKVGRTRFDPARVDVLYVDGRLEPAPDIQRVPAMGSAPGGWVGIPLHN